MKKTTRQADIENVEADPDSRPEYPEEEAENTLLKYWRLVLRHKWGILGITVAAVLIGALTAFSATPIYRASATLLVEPAQPKFSSTQPLAVSSPLMLFYETQYEIIRSRAIAETVVDKLGLADRDDYLGLDKTGLLDSVKTWLGDWLAQESDVMDDKQRHSAAVDKVQRDLSVRGGQKSQIVVINYDFTHPALAAQIANAVTQAYSEYGMESRLATVKEATSWLSSRLRDLRRQLEQSEATLEAFQSRESMVATENSRQMINTKMANLAAELVKAQTTRSQAQIHYEQVLRLRNEGKDMDALVPQLNSPLINRLSEEHASLKRKFSELSERYGEKHPKIVAAKADLDETARRLEAEIGQSVDSIRKELEVAESKEREAQRQLDTQQKEMRDVTGKGFDLVKLEREVETNRQLYETFFARYKEIDNSGDSNITNVRVIDHALPPAIPYKPQKRRMIIVSLVLGLFLGIAVAFVREKLDNTFKRGDDIEAQLLLPVLTEIALLEKQAGRTLVPERHILAEPRSAFAEAINNVRTGILFSNLDKPVKTLLITSTVPGEGKTTLASNLAISFSQLGRTLLIDGDMRKPAIHRVAKTAKGAGFSDWLQGTHTLEQCCQPDGECANLFVMPSGKIPPNPLELLSSKTFRKSFQDLRKKYEYIIIDTPPILPGSDAIVLGNVVDAVILSVIFGGTTYPMAQEAVKRLRANNIEPIGAVLSMVDIKKAQSYDGSHYSGAYGTYSEQPET
ncbi:MAG: gumC [Gammaproteobacteria bacterium]|nr:MAG: gumC [Gammaproteobacteria bacterium]TND07333.1 MAG: gumC [Gammaproteobacteria bacterium]